MSEMHRLAEDSVPQVRAELARLHCSGVIAVGQDETRLKLKYGEKCFVADPLGLLAVLRGIHEIEDSDVLWQTITQEASQYQKGIRLKVLILMLSLMSILVVMLTVVYF